jgi:hypothetical protein
MSVPLAILGVALAWGAAAVFFALGLTLLRRPVSSDDARLATTLFSFFWFGVGVSNFSSGLRIPLAAADVPLTVLVGLSFIGYAALTMGLAGLLYYLVFLFTGQSFVVWPLVVFYALICAWLIRSTASWRPSGVEVAAWSARILYEQPLQGQPQLVALLALVGPQLLAVIAIFVVAARLPRSAARVRMVVVGAAILTWFGGTLLANVFAIDGTAWQVIRALLPILVGLAVILVHRPPPWLAWRLPPEIPEAIQRGTP